MNQDPLNMPLCNIRNVNSWINCMKGQNEKKNPEDKDMSNKERRAVSIDHCCKLEMQCKNPNKLLKNNIFDAVCTPSKPLVGPHFGDVRMPISHTLSFGVY